MTASHFAFMFDPASVSAEDLEEVSSIMTEDEKSVLKISAEEYIIYTPEGDEYRYYTKMPGIKLYPEPAISIEKAKEIADRLADLVSAKKGVKVNIILIDNEKLKTLSE
jgi:hypothetical protein